MLVDFSYGCEENFRRSEMISSLHDRIDYRKQINSETCYVIKDAGHRENS